MDIYKNTRALQPWHDWKKRFRAGGRVTQGFWEAFGAETKQPRGQEAPDTAVKAQKGDKHPK